MIYFSFIQEGADVIVQVKSDVLTNAWQGSVILPKSAQNVRVNIGASFADIWQQTPVQNGSQIHFTAGKINGFIGEEELFRFSLAPGNAYPLQFSKDTSAYLNDGLGTKAQVSIPASPFVVNVSAEMISPTTDTVPPESFIPQLYLQEGFFDERPVVLFSTKDLQSGVSHYEVRELTDSGTIDWHTAESPYLISSDVKSIEIKAVDYYGNERIEMLNVRANPFFTLSVIAVVILGIAILYTISRWRKPRKKKL